MDSMGLGHGHKGRYSEIKKPGTDSTESIVLDPSAYI